MEDLDRYRAFDVRRLSLLSTRVQPFDAGVAYFDDAYPDRYVANLLVVDRDDVNVSSDHLVARADEILGGAGLSHRLVKILHDRGEHLAPGFRAHGYDVERVVAMLLRRPPDRPASLTAEECSFDELRPLTEEIYRRDLPPEPELARRFVEQHATWDRILGTRRFAVRIDGALAGQCELFLIGTDAQVEFVDTLEEFRGLGVARAVVLAAVEAARAAGAERVFIAADDDDWPKSLYERVGFDRIGRVWEFQRRPAEEAPPR